MIGKRFSKPQSDLVSGFLSGYVTTSEGRYTTIDDLLRVFVQVTKNVRLEYHTFLKLMKHLKPRYVYKNKDDYIIVDHVVHVPTLDYVSTAAEIGQST